MLAIMDFDELEKRIHEKLETSSHARRLVSTMLTSFVSMCVLLIEVSKKETKEDCGTKDLFDI